MTKHKYAKGTQAMLDTAKDDATKLPFDTVFIYFDEEVVREEYPAWDDNFSVNFVLAEGGLDIPMLSSEDLLPAKKPKQKKDKPLAWQNGTQAQLDNAKDDARKIPKKTYFMSKYGDTDGTKVYRVDNEYNSADEVMMSNANFECDFHAAFDLEPINEN